MPKGKKKDKAPKISYYEALLGYKIGLKEKELENANFQASELTEKNTQFKLRNVRLKESRDMYLKKALKEYREYTKQLDSSEKCEKKDVLDEMFNLWNFKKSLDDELIDLKIQIKQTENDIKEHKKEYKSWVEFKNKGKNDLDIQIKLLKQEILGMHENFEIMSRHLEDSLDTTREQITKNTEESISKEHKSVAEKVFKEMDKYTVQMMHDNKWMQEKIKLFIEESNVLNEETNGLEKENIELMSKLFECNTTDLRFTKNAFQAQFLDNENLEKNSILDIDLDKLDTLRPKSSFDMVVEKVLSYQIPDKVSEIDSDNEFNMDQKSNIFKYTETSDKPKEFEFNTYVNLGPYEYKSLGLKGYKKPIYKPKTPSIEEIKTHNYGADEWPITHEMLNMSLND